MKKLVLVIIVLLLAIPTAWGVDFLNFPNFPSRAGSGSSFDKKFWWDTDALTFYAPFDDASNPLRLVQGTGSLSFTPAPSPSPAPRRRRMFIPPPRSLLQRRQGNWLSKRRGGKSRATAQTCACRAK